MWVLQGLGWMAAVLVGLVLVYIAARLISYAWHKSNLEVVKHWKLRSYKNSRKKRR